MPLCNNISPMFLIGYVCNQYLNGQINTINVLAVIYLPQICYAILYYLLSKNSLHISLFKQNKKTVHRSPNDAKDLQIPLSETTGTMSEYAAAQDIGNTPSVIENSITTITVIGIYVAVFSVLYNLAIACGGPGDNKRSVRIIRFSTFFHTKNSSDPFCYIVRRSLIPLPVHAHFKRYKAVFCTLYIR